MENKTNTATLKRNTKKYEEYLDSDDEFPLEFNEIPSLPVYKNDNRFDKIVFKWIKDQESYNLKTNVPLEQSIIADNISKDLISNSAQDFKEILVIKSGVLSKHDLFCLKSIEEGASDATFTWLLNFLIYKDLQSRYMFLRSCLVSTKLHNDRYYSIKETTSSTLKSKKRFKLLIKM